MNKQVKVCQKLFLRSTSSAQGKDGKKSGKYGGLKIELEGYD